MKSTEHPERADSPEGSVSLSNSLPSGNTRFSAWLLLFGAYVFLLTAFNRSFAYLHFHVGSLPLYVTELVLFAAAVKIAIHRDWLARARAHRLSAQFLLGAGGLTLLVLLKLLLQTRALSAEALRNGALGYYSFAGVCGFALATDPDVRTFCRKAFVAGAICSTMIFWAMSLMPDAPVFKLFQDFHGLPVLAWASVGGMAILSGDWPKGRAALNRIFFSLFLLATPLMYGGRSVVMATVLTLAVFAVLGLRQVNRIRTWTLLGGIALGFLLAWVRMQNWFTVGRQDVWQESWRSWSRVVSTAQSLNQSGTAIATTPEAIAPPVAVEHLTPTVIEEALQKPVAAAGIASKEVVVPSTNVSVVPLPPVRPPTRIQQLVAVWNTDIQLPDDWNPDLSLAAAYYPARQTLLLISPKLTGEFLKRRLSSNLNNAAWRLELWRLASNSTLHLFPITGLPLQVKIHFAAFDFFNYSDRTDLHNSHLAIFVRFGVVGIILYLIAVLSAVGGLFTRILSKPTPADAVIFSGILLLAVLACFNVMLEGPFLGVPFWLFLGTAAARATRPE